MTESLAGKKTVDVIGGNHNAIGAQHEGVVQIGLGFSLASHLEIGAKECGSRR